MNGFDLDETKEISEAKVLIDNSKEDMMADIDEDNLEHYRDVFNFFDWNSSNTIHTSVSICINTKYLYMGSL